MNPSFDITSLVPGEESQSHMLREFRDASSTRARDHALVSICTEFGPFVCQIARWHWRRSGRINRAAGLADIEAAGRLGLLTAARRWSPDFGKPFAHLASRWIAGSCKSEARQLTQGIVTIPPKVRRLCREYRGVADGEREKLLAQSRSRHSTKVMIRYLAQADSPHPLSLISEYPDGSICEVARADEPTAAAQAETSEQIAKLRSVLLNRCSARERLIFFLLFPHWPLDADEIGDVVDKNGDRIELAAIDLTTHIENLAAIGDLLKLTRERVRQIHAGTLQKLRIALAYPEHNSDPRRRSANLSGATARLCHSSATVTQ